MISIYTDTDKTTQLTEGDTEVFDFGKRPKDFDTSVVVFIKGENLSITQVSSTCGCTVAKECKVNDNLYSLNITYKNSHQKKPFGKTVTVTLLQDGNTITKKLKVKGIIT
jgi:hypothetical protein